MINGSKAGDGTIGDTFINTGTLTITSGTFQAAAGGTNFGTITVQGSGLVGVAGGFYFADISVFVLSGSGGIIRAPVSLSMTANIERDKSVRELDNQRRGPHLTAL